SYSDAQDGDALARTLEELVGASLKRGVLRIQAVDPGGHPIEVYLPRLLNDRGEIVFDDNDADTGGYRTNYVSGTQRIDLDPGDYSFTVAMGRDQQSEQLAFQDQAMYTATVVAGRETLATVGFGSIAFVNAGMDASAADGLGLQKWIDGEWRKTLYNSDMSFEAGAFRFDQAITLAPGRYRVRDVERDQVLVDNIVVRAGDELRVEVGGRRSVLRMQAIGPDGQPVEVYVPTIWNESGKVVTQVEDADSGEARDATFKGTQRVDLKPGTYRFRVSLSPAASKQLEQHGYHDEFAYTAVVAENQETPAIIGYGGLTLVDAGLPAAARGDIMIEKAVGGKWRDTIFTQELAFDRQYVLAPGRYRIVDDNRDVVLVDDIVIEPGKAVRAELRP
ncbi:MAG: hypothetical protein H7Y32_19555, partial [Chloroflexales bacterium]|nr:hypothetical protein [Chloroflexales bacterium]